MSRTKSFSRLNRSLVLSALILVFISATARTASAQDELSRLEDLWKRQEYARVLPELVDYRERTGNKTLGLDYMIATSACRTSDHRLTGSEFFSWILYNYNLSGPNRGLVERERQKCSANARPESLGLIVPASLVGVSYDGKVGRELRATSSGNSAARVVDPIPPETFARRLFEASAWKTAAKGVATLLGPDHAVEHIGSFLLIGPSKLRSFAVPDSPDTSLPATATTEAPNRASIPNDVRVPNRSVTPNESVTPNSAATPNVPIANTSQRPKAGVQPLGVDPSGVSPAGVNTSGVDPRNVNPATVNTANASPENARAVPPSEVAMPNQAVSRLNVEQRTQPGQMVQQGLPTDSSADDEYGLKRVGEELERYSRFFVSEYSMRAPPRLITVYFARNIGELQSLAGKLHGIALAPGSLGYSFPADQSMVGWADGRAYGTFAHELFHLMARNSFGDIPPWLDEGMAALYEVSGFDGVRALGVPNWRGEILRDLWVSRPHLRALVQMNRSAFDDVVGRSDQLRAGENQAVNHATARYFMLYLQERGQLKPLYRAFLNRRVSDPPAKQATELVESVLRSSLDQVDQDFARWFKSLPR